MTDKQMSLVEHLDELRRRILVSVVAVIVCSCVAFLKIQVILDLLMFPPVDHLAFFSPTEAFFEYCKLAFFSGLFPRYAICSKQSFQPDIFFLQLPEFPPPLPVP